ncbi:MAG: YcjF family protein [Candidatus Accumulibacter sp.]|nr:YcjF family protein [Accumulibacter sp.]
MSRIITRIFVAAGLAVLGYFFLSLVSTISQLAGFADRLSPGSAAWVFWGLILLFSGLLLTPVYLYSRLSALPVPPSGEDPDAVESFLGALREHLRDNPRLSDMELTSNEEVPLALSRLGEMADVVVKRTASTVFVSTAVMQNGRLDGLFVLANQLRLVWRIASIYHGRPSPRQMLSLYGNVGANVLIADNLQEIDFAEIATPVVASIFPSIKGGIPGLQGVSTLLVNSLSNGAANAFLTLRVGLITKAYCAALSAPMEGGVRRSSTTEALTLVAGIVREQGGRVAEKSWQRVRDTFTEATGATVQGVKGALRRTAGATIETARTVSDTFGGGVRSIKDMMGK